jgi:integrase/recombinase XerD
MNTSYKAILSEYLQWLDTLGYSDDVIKCCKVNVRLFLEWLEEKGIQSINLLTNRHIREYHRYLETRPNKIWKERLLSVAHLNKNYIAIDKLLEFLQQYGMNKLPVPTNKRIKADEQARIQKIEPLTQQEIKILYDCIPNTYPYYHCKLRQEKQYELRLMLTLLYGCGLRRNEAYNLQIQDVDFDRKTVFVKQGKGYKDRIVPMSAGVYNDLQDYLYNFRS